MRTRWWVAAPSIHAASATATASASGARPAAICSRTGAAIAATWRSDSSQSQSTSAEIRPSRLPNQ